MAGLSSRCKRFPTPTSVSRVAVDGGASCDDFRRIPRRNPPCRCSEHRPGIRQGRWRGRDMWDSPPENLARLRDPALLARLNQLAVLAPGATVEAALVTAYLGVTEEELGELRRRLRLYRSAARRRDNDPPGGRRRRAVAERRGPRRTPPRARRARRGRPDVPAPRERRVVGPAGGRSIPMVVAALPHQEGRTDGRAGPIS